MERVKLVSARIKELDQEVKDLEERLQELLLEIPNIPHESVPAGGSDEENVEVKRVGEPPRFDFEPQGPTGSWASALGILDFERAGKVTGARLLLPQGGGARLERALIQFMLDLHTAKHGYTELSPPFIVNAASMTGTGQLPKFARGHVPPRRDASAT